MIRSGLLKMTIEIVKILLRTLAEGIVLDNGVFNSLLARYVRTAEDTLKRYHADALINGLTFDRHLEIAVAAFSKWSRSRPQEPSLKIRWERP
jgi:glucosyl-3-phosphoglycerate synthase